MSNDIRFRLTDNALFSVWLFLPVILKMRKVISAKASHIVKLLIKYY